MTRLALSNVFHRKTRTALSAIAVALEVALLMVLIGLTNGTLQEAGERIENIRSDVLVLPPGAQFMLGMSTAVMPLEPVRAALESAEHVIAAAPVIFTTTNAFGSYALVFGIEPNSYALAGRGSFKFVDGHNIEGPDDLVVDTRIARANGLAVGQKVEILNHTFTISGIVQDGAGVRLYLPIGTLQDLLGRTGKASVFFVRVADADRAGDVVDRIRRTPAFKGYNIVPSSRYTELLGTNAFGLKEFNAAVTVVAVAFGFIVISLSMYTTILERTRQIGILKSMGAGNAFIVGEVVLEATLLVVIGIPLGVGLAGLVKTLLHAAYPTLIILFSFRWLLNAVVLALVSGVLGALYPAYRASNVDPVVAMAFE